MIEVEQTSLATCDACDVAAPCIGVTMRRLRVLLCHECMSVLMLDVSNIMLPLIAQRLEARRSKL